MHKSKTIIISLVIAFMVIMATFYYFAKPKAMDHQTESLSTEIGAPPAPDIDRSQDRVEPQSSLHQNNQNNQPEQEIAIPTEGFAPHKALYDIKITRIKSGSPVTGVSGDMFYKWSDECSGYATDHRFNIRYDYAEQPAVRISSRYIAFEYKNGSEMSYVSIHDENGKRSDEISGIAKRKDDKSGEAINTKPEGLRFTLPQDFVFPTQHTKEVLARAMRGDKFYSAIMYDGSDAEGPIEINAVIGKETKTADISTKAGVDERLLSNRAWPVRLAFFKYLENNQMSDEDIKPLYEMDILLHENGVVSEINVDYDSFSVRQDLTALTPLPLKLDCQ